MQFTATWIRLEGILLREVHKKEQISEALIHLWNIENPYKVIGSTEQYPFSIVDVQNLLPNTGC